MKTKDQTNRKALPAGSPSPLSLKLRTAIAVKLFFGLFLLYFLNSCVPCYYAPSAQNVPLLQRKKDSRASGGIRIGSYTVGCDFQGAFALTSQLGIMANYSYNTGLFSPSDDTTLSGLKGNLVEIGLGYYKPFKDKYVFELYSGAGTSWIRTPNDNFYGLISSTIHSWNLFIQPTFGMHKKNMEFAYSTRLRVLDYNHLEYDPEDNGKIDQVMMDLEGLPMTYLIEPAFTYRTGKGLFKTQVQLGFSIPLNNNDYLAFDPFYLSIGMVLKIPGEKRIGLTK